MAEAMWSEHLGMPFPPECRGTDVDGVDLVVLDADAAGCVEVFFESHVLDERRQHILERCVADLQRVVPALEGDAREYFRHLEGVAAMVLHRVQADRV